MLSVKQGGIKYHFWVFGMTPPGVETRSPGPLANTLLIWPMTLLNNSIQHLFIHLHRLGSSALVRQLVEEKENSKFKPVKLLLKIDLVSYPARAEGLVNMIKKMEISKHVKIKELVSEVRNLYFTEFPLLAAFCYGVSIVSAGLPSLWTND